MLIHLRCFCLDLELEELIGSHIVLNLYPSHIKLLVACHHDKLDAFGDFNRACVLEGPHVLDLIALLEHHVLLQ